MVKWFQQQQPEIPSEGMPLEHPPQGLYETVAMASIPSLRTVPERISFQ
jgi:hypothetical protein